MDRNPNEPTDRDDRLDEALGGYFDGVEKGRAPDRRELIDRYPSLAAELEAFFADEDRLDRFAAPLRPAARAALTHAVTREMTARPFGPYTLLRELGRGAMGVVYEAEQDSPRRTVALKMIRDPGGSCAADVGRFKNEAQAAAQLDHPNVVPIYEVGECEGQPYFTMKYLSGSLAQHLSRFTNDPRSAARLVADVARAVHHAHQRGVLHRDLKPSNILFDEEHRPHVADFGLAKRLESDGELTQSGALVGTPNYMAPEQALGRRAEVTTATDVYGLGAVLYTLLTGRPPFRGETVLEILEQVKAREPEPPSRLNDRVDRDLETIGLKCLEKEPARRYSSADELADDLDRWLAGEPVQARPVGRSARLWRWCRRNPAVAGLSATVAVLVLLALIGLAGTVVVVWQERAQTQAALAQSRKNAARAYENLRRFLDGVGRLTIKLHDQHLAGAPQLAEIRRSLIADIQRSLFDFSDEHDDDPVVRRDLAIAYVHFGTLFALETEDALARRAFERAITILSGLVAGYPAEPDYWLELGASRVPLGEILWWHGQADEAAAEYRRAAESFQRAFDLGHSPRAANHYSWLLATCPDTQFRDPAKALELAQFAVSHLPDQRALWNGLGVAHYRAGNWDECIAALGRSLQLRTGDGDSEEDPIDPLFLAMAYHRRGDREKAVQYYQQGLRLFGGNDLHGPAHSFRVLAEAKTVLGIDEEPARPKGRELGSGP